MAVKLDKEVNINVKQRWLAIKQLKQSSECSMPLEKGGARATKTSSHSSKSARTEPAYLLRIRTRRFLEAICKFWKCP